MADRTVQARRYARIKRWLWLGDLCVTLTWCGLALHLGWSAAWADWAAHATSLRWGRVALYGLFFGGCMYLVSLPMHIYGSYILEHRFHLSNQSFRQWLWREGKHVVLAALLGLLFLEGLYLCIDSAPRLWWVWLAVGWWAVSVILARILPTVIIPLFYTCVPLEDGALRRTLVELSARVRVPIMNAFRIDLSRDTKKANAAVVGWGKTRRVLMADTLLNHFTPEEVTAVVAHELGHHRYHHISLHLGVSFITALGGFGLLYYGSQRWFPAGVAELAWFPALLMGLVLLQLCLMPLDNGLSRVLERQADQFALDVTHAPQPFISTMRKLADLNLAEVTPPRWIEWLFYSHPAMHRRIAMGEAYVYQEIRRARATGQRAGRPHKR